MRSGTRRHRFPKLLERELSIGAHANDDVVAFPEPSFENGQR
jgi:hypothetical protein